jgi:hypothetical protein
VLASSLAKQVATIEPQGAAISRDQLEQRAGIYFQPTTLDVLRLVVRDGKLVVKQDEGFGPSLVPLSDKRFRIVGQPAELDFDDGDRAGFTRRGLAGRPLLHFERREAVSLPPRALAAYAGDYVSEELGGTVYRVTATDSTLELRTGTSDPIAAHAAFADTFVGRGYTIQFARARGTIGGFEISNGRVRRVAFTRVTVTPR